jgi:DNA invertase Pin-like site-specific DNA recombinase
LENVIWGTASENQLDRRRHGTSPQGENHPKAIVTEEQVRDIRELLAAGYTTVAIAKRFGVNRYLISDIKRGRSWSYLK